MLVCMWVYLFIFVVGNTKIKLYCGYIDYFKIFLNIFGVTYGNTGIIFAIKIIVI